MNCLNTSGFIYIMKILPGNMENFIEIIEMLLGILINKRMLN